MRFKVKPTHKKPAKVVKRKLTIMTLALIRERAYARIRELDKAVEMRKAERRAYTDLKSILQPTPVDLRKPEEIMSTTNGACFRPDLYFRAHKACDQCSMYPWCMAPCKKLKIKGSQPDDKTQAFLKQRAKEARAREAAEVEILEVRRPKLRVTVGKKRKIKLRVKSRI